MGRKIETIRKSGLCTGCGLCAGVDPDAGVSMEETQAGWLRPKTNGPIVDKAHLAISEACPGVKLERSSVDEHAVWGPVREVHLSWATDEALRHSASSGGGLSAMLQYMLDVGEVDYVVQTSVSSESAIRNTTVVTKTPEQVKNCAGSRYAPSAPLQNLESYLASPGRFAFIGKPCDVAALRQYARIDSRVNQKIPWMLTFFCGGLPSYRGTDELIEAMQVPRTAQISSFRFRGNGWPGFATAVTTDGDEYTMDYNKSWGTILNRFIQFRCKICPDGIGSFADISFADGWHCDDKGYPLFDERDGRSLTLLRNDRAIELFRRAIAAGNLKSELSSVGAIEKMQPFQAARRRLLLPRLTAYILMGHRPPRYRGFRIFRNALDVSASLHIRNFLGTFRRLLRNRNPG